MVPWGGPLGRLHACFPNELYFHEFIYPQISFQAKIAAIENQKRLIEPLRILICIHGDAGSFFASLPCLEDTSLHDNARKIFLAAFPAAQWAARNIVAKEDRKPMTAL